MLRTRFAIAIALIAAAAPLNAQPSAPTTITFNTITPTWSNLQPSNVSNLSIDNSGSTIGLTWGTTGFFGFRSQLRFNDVNTPLTVTLNNGSARFNLGEFTHLNTEVTGNALTGAYLNFLFGVTGSTTGNFTTSYQVNYEQTPNDAPCPFGTTAQNRNGCADRVSLGAPITQNRFTLNSQQYLISLLGFSTSATRFNNSGPIVTRENGVNDAYLWAEINRYDASVVPEPSTYALMATGLAGLVGIARRRRAAVK